MQSWRAIQSRRTIKNGNKSCLKVNNDHFLLRFRNTLFYVILVQVIFSMSGASSYNFENKGKY